ncbi:MAG: hypothetical protein ACLU22_11645 [Clostridium sp.]
MRTNANATILATRDRHRKSKLKEVQLSLTNELLYNEFMNGGSVAIEKIEG